MSDSNTKANSLVQTKRANSGEHPLSILSRALLDLASNIIGSVDGTLKTAATLFTFTVGVRSSSVLGNGYAAGAGGTVTQLTSKSTGVTLSKACGEITLHNASLAAGTIVSFTLTNTSIGVGDVLVLNHVSGGTVGSYSLTAACAAGTAVIYVRNNTAGSLGEAVVIRFSIVKGVTA